MHERRFRILRPQVLFLSALFLLTFNYMHASKEASLYFFWGLMMLGLGLVLLINTNLFANLFVAIGLLVIALATMGIIILLTKKMEEVRVKR